MCNEIKEDVSSSLVWFGLIQTGRDESLRQLRVVLPLNISKKNNVLVAS